VLIENMLGNVGKLFGKVGKRLKIRKLYHNRHGYTCTEAQEMTPVRAWLRTIQVPPPLSPTVPADTETEIIFMNEKNGVYSRSEYVSPTVFTGNSQEQKDDRS